MLQFPASPQKLFEYNREKREELLKVCDPLFKNTPIQGIFCGRILSGGKFFILSTHLEWVQQYLQTPLPLESSCIKSLQNAREDAYQYHLWPQKPAPRNISGLCYEFNIWNVLSIHKREKDAVCFWNFTASRECESLENFYINHKGLLEKFLKYLNECIPWLLEPPKFLDLAQFQEIFDINPPVNPALTSAPSKILKDFLNSTSPRPPSSSPFYFSKRERESLSLLSQGLTIKQIAQALDLSPRTIEFYLNNIRDKTGCRNRVKLVKLFEAQLSKQ